MTTIDITVHAETSTVDADAVRADAVTALETVLPYMFDNVLVTSRLTDPEATNTEATATGQPLTYADVLRRDAESEQVFLLDVTHRHGHDVSPYRSRAGAEAALLGYVTTNWEDEVASGRFGGEHRNRVLPYEATAAIDAYFAVVEDEDYVISQMPLLP